MTSSTAPERPSRPRLGVFKFASCDGCQLTLLDCEDELLGLAHEMEIAHFLEASGDVGPGPYDLALVEGSVSTPRTRPASGVSVPNRVTSSPSAPAPPRAASRRCGTTRTPRST